MTSKDIKQNEQPVTLLVLGHKRPYLARIELEYLCMGIHVKCDYKELTEAPKWYKRIFKKANVDDIWWDVNIAPLASGYDMCLLVTNVWNRSGSNGYAERKQRHGIWRGFVKDAKKPRRYGKSSWNGEDQITGTSMHELSHLMHSATGQKDRTHELDKAGRIKEARFSGDRFKGWSVPNKKRMFKWSEYWRLTKTEDGIINKKYKTKKLKMRVCTEEEAKVIRKQYTNFIPKW